MLEKNKVYTAEITGITSEGSGVCRIDEMAVFVPDSAVGDKLEVRIVKVLKSYAFGIVENIITPSPDRIESSCPHYKKCGGCVFRHISYEAESEVKNNIVKDAFKRLGGIDIDTDTFISADNTERYRNKAQYPIATQDGKAVCGFYAPRSHRVIPIGDCLLQPEIFADIVNTSLTFINEKKLPVYDEKSHTGIMRLHTHRCTLRTDNGLFRSPQGLFKTAHAACKAAVRQIQYHQKCCHEHQPRQD